MELTKRHNTWDKLKDQNYSHISFREPQDFKNKPTNQKNPNSKPKASDIKWPIISSCMVTVIFYVFLKALP